MRDAFAHVQSYVNDAYWRELMLAKGPCTDTYLLSLTVPNHVVQRAALELMALCTRYARGIAM